MINTKEVSAKELSKITGVSERKLRDWKADGMPCTPNKKGTRFTYNVADVLVWYEPRAAKPNQLDILARIETYVYGCGEEEPQKPQEQTKKSKQPSKKSAKNTFSFSSDSEEVDTFGARQIVGQLLHAAADRLMECDPKFVMMETNTISKLTDQIRKSDLACIELDKVLKNIVPINQVYHWIQRALMKAKNDLSALPFAVADDLAVIDNPEEIAALLKEKINDALRHLAKEFNPDEKE